MVFKPPVANEILKNAQLPDQEVDLENLKGHAGQPLKEKTPFATIEQVMTAIKTVEDPEIPVNLVDLGLIYGCERDAKGNLTLTMSLTSPTCPTANEMPQMVADAAASVSGVGEVDVQVIWNPAWSMEMMSEEARFELDYF